jgi:large subunit ribosomal protein L4
MATLDVRDAQGNKVGTVDASDDVFAIQPNVPVMHQVVTAQLAARRAGTQSTKTRAEVAGGGGKPWRQKGTGRARQGSSRSPHWRGGGVALGPKPRSYKQRTPKKMINLALRSALSDRFADGKVAVLDEWVGDTPKTKDALALLDALGLDGRVLVVLGPHQDAAWKSFRNLQGVHLLLASELNAYDILCADWIVFTKDVVPGSGASADGTTARKTPSETAVAIGEPEAEQEPEADADADATEGDEEE